ncbi:MAG: sugar ABC transporter permease [Anaerolineae bacterium]|jgi:ABC-type sugar transport system permease subunit|nr:sugar ABC transporter permease [Anaerolineae bacterium]
MLSHRLYKIFPYVLIAPAMLLVLLVSLYPTLYSFYLAFHRNRRGVLEYVGTRNFEVIVNSDAFWNSLRLTAVFGIFFVGLVMLFGFLLALVFNRNLQGGGIYMTIIFIPWMLSEIVAGVMWRWMFLPQLGVLQNALSPLLGDITFLATGSGALGVVIGATLWRSLAFAMLLLLAGLQTVPKELSEAGMIDGANRWQVFWRITWPLMLPTTQITFVFLTIQAVNAVGMFLSITQGGPGTATDVLSLQMYREAIEFFNFGYGAALSVVMFVINAVLAFVYISTLRAQHAFD